MKFILALLPILLILFLMVRLRWGAAQAGIVGYTAAMLLAVFFFGARANLLWVAHGKSLLLTLDVLMIVWAAYLHFRFTEEAGAIRMIGEALPKLTRDKGMLALLLGWAFASFLQGAGGFGVPIAVVAPLLIGLGFAPLAAVVIPAVGHGWAVTYGSLGASFQALMVTSGWAGEYLDGPAAILLGIAGIATGFFVVHMASGWAGVRRLWGAVLIIGGLMAGVQYGVAELSLWNLASFGAGLAGIVAAVVLARYLNATPAQPEEKTPPRQIVLAFLSYGILLIVTLGISLIPGVKQTLGELAILQVHFPAVSTTQGFLIPAETGRVIKVFSHTGTLMLYAAGLTYFAYRWAGQYEAGAARRVFKDTARKMALSSIGVTMMVLMAVVMAHAGMTEALARGLAEGIGRAFPLVSPWIGALGAFMTGSNMNSNIVFTQLQLQTAELLGFTIPWILAAQTTGAAIGSVIAPTKILVGASTAGMTGKEGEVIAALARYVVALIFVVTIGLLLILGVLA